MKRYEVTLDVPEWHTTHVEVEADTPEEAEEKAKQLIYSFEYDAEWQAAQELTYGDLKVAGVEESE